MDIKRGRTSQDFEDIVYVLENRESVWDEIKASDEKLKIPEWNKMNILLKIVLVRRKTHRCQFSLR